MKDEYLEDEGKVVLVKKEGNANRPIKAQDCFTKIKPPRGRPSLKLNSIGLFVVQTLASFRCPEEEIAAKLGVTVETLKNKYNREIFSELIKKGHLEYNAQLRMNQLTLSKHNGAVAIFLGKQYLDQRDEKHIDLSGNVDVVPDNIKELSKDDLMKLAETLERAEDDGSEED